MKTNSASCLYEIPQSISHLAGTDGLTFYAPMNSSLWLNFDTINFELPNGVTGTICIYFSEDLLILSKQRNP